MGKAAELRERREGLRYKGNPALQGHGLRRKQLYETTVCVRYGRRQSGVEPPHFYEKAVLVKGDGFANDAATLLCVLEAQKVDAFSPPLHLQIVLAGRRAATS